MSYLYQARELIILQYLTINYEMEISDEELIAALGDTVSKTPDYFPQLISKVRRLLPIGAIERVPEYGYVYRSRHAVR